MRTARAVGVAILRTVMLGGRRYDTFRTLAAYRAFGVSGVLIASASEGDDERGDLLAIEIDGVVQTGVKDG